MVKIDWFFYINKICTLVDDFALIPVDREGGLHCYDHDGNLVCIANTNDELCLVNEKVDLDNLPESGVYYEVSPPGDRIWVHSKSDGSTVGRFCAMGIDIHNTVTDMLNGKGECLDCRHDLPETESWPYFVKEVHRHYGITIPFELYKGNVNV